MQGLADGLVRNHLFRFELYTIEQAISAAEQDDLSMRHAHVSSTFIRPPRLQEIRGPEPMDILYVESVMTRFSDNKRLNICNRCKS